MLPQPTDNHTTYMHDHSAHADHLDANTVEMGVCNAMSLFQSVHYRRYHCNAKSYQLIYTGELQWMSRAVTRDIAAINSKAHVI